jgi:hypothetical protein
MLRFGTGLGLVALAALAACDVPTAAPIYDTLWNVPGKSTSISVNGLLPTGVQISQDNSAFQVAASPAVSVITRQLGQDCSACLVAGGQTIPKPAFVGGGSANVAFPTTVSTATFVRDSLTVTIANVAVRDLLSIAGHNDEKNLVIVA